jgi:hypothetical protein
VRVVLLVGAACVLIASVAPAWGSPGRADQDEAKAVSGAAEALRGKKRPGCRRFCQQAGGIGCRGPCLPIPPEQQPVMMLRQTLDGTRDRIVKVTATCNLDTDCVGAIILISFRGEYGRADLRIPARTEVKVPVGLSRRGLDTLEKEGRDRNVEANVTLKRPVPARKSISEPLTLLPPRR